MKQLCACILLALALSLPASAQETGTLIVRKGADAYDGTAAGARRTMRGLGRCIVQGRSGQVAKTLELALNDAEYAKRMDRLVAAYDDPCLRSGELTMSSALLRQSLVEAMYVRTYADELPPVSYYAALRTGYRELHGAEPDRATRSALALYQLGECVARKDPISAHRLVLTDPGSGSEDSAFAAVVPHISGCVIAGEQLRFSKSTIKGAIAEGAWRLRRAQADSGTMTKPAGGGQ